jgi:hypothetical protein
MALTCKTKSTTHYCAYYQHKISSIYKYNSITPPLKSHCFHPLLSNRSGSGGEFRTQSVIAGPHVDIFLKYQIWSNLLLRYTPNHFKRQSTKLNLNFQTVKQHITTTPLTCVNAPSSIFPSTNCLPSSSDRSSRASTLEVSWGKRKKKEKNDKIEGKR